MGGEAGGGSDTARSAAVLGQSTGTRGSGDSGATHPLLQHPSSQEATKPRALGTPKEPVCAVATYCCDWILSSAWRLDFGPTGFGGQHCLVQGHQTGGSSTPARQPVLPSLEVLRNRGSPPKTFTYKICAIKLPAL
ncbi:hypothetical protein STEG23_003598, partial [Scotinomys teguina]